MFEAIRAPLFFGLIAAFVTTLGLIAVATRSDWSRRHANLFGLAAAGMLLTLTLTHIAPSAFESTRHAPTLMLGGFLGGILLSFTIRAVFPDRDGSARATEAFTPVAAIACHSFIDGIIYTVTFAADFTSGVYTSLSLILHEFPEGVMAFAILRGHGVNNRQSFRYALYAAALTTPLGVLAAGPAIAFLGPEVIQALFAISAGLLLYVATGPLMAPINVERPMRGLTALLTGVTIGLLLAYSPLHTDHHGHGDGRPDFRTTKTHGH